MTGFTKTRACRLISHTLILLMLWATGPSELWAAAAQRPAPGKAVPVAPPRPELVPELQSPETPPPVTEGPVSAEPGSPDTAPAEFPLSNRTRPDLTPHWVRDGKGRRDRRVPLLGRAASALRVYLDARRELAKSPEEALLFTRDGRRLSKSALDL